MDVMRAVSRGGVTGARCGRGVTDDDAAGKVSSACRNAGGRDARRYGLKSRRERGAQCRSISPRMICVDGEILRSLLKTQYLKPTSRVTGTTATKMRTAISHLWKSMP